MSCPHTKQRAHCAAADGEGSLGTHLADFGLLSTAALLRSRSLVAHDIWILKGLCPAAADGEGGLEAKLADFGLHATIEALHNSSLSKRLCESSLHMSYCHCAAAP